MTDYDAEDLEHLPAEQPKPDQAVTVHQEQRSVTPFDQNPAQFAVQLQRRGENYKALVTWLVDNFTSEHVQQIHHVKRDQCNLGGPAPRGNCGPTTTPWHWSAPDLSRKGDEMVMGLLGLGARFPGMADFRRQALRGVKITDVIIECELYDGGGGVISHGTGACTTSEVNGSLHNAMTRACKRATHDAIKRCAGLSGLAAELKERMGPVDPAQAESAAKDAQRRAAGNSGGGGRWETGADLPTCPFGKHKGKPWLEVPTDYLEWMVKEASDKPDVLRAAAGELTKRRNASPGSGSTHTQPSPHSPDSDLPPLEGYDQ